MTGRDLMSEKKQSKIMVLCDYGVHDKNKNICTVYIYIYMYIDTCSHECTHVCP